MNVNTAYDVRLLEDLFSEPHCTATHAHHNNRECAHTVTHYMSYPCGCGDDACINQYRYVSGLIGLNRPAICTKCSMPCTAEDVVITPRIS